MIRAQAAMSVSRFAELIGVPRRTYQYRLAKHRAGDPPKGPWPAPVVDRIEPVVAKYAQDWPAWGHRKIAAIARIDGHDIGSMSSVKRAMARRGLLQPVRYQAERRQLAAARRAVFVEPVERRNRVWQMDFSEFETAAGGTWRLGGVVDYFTKLALACPVTATGTAADLTAALDAAAAQAEALLGHELSDDCVDEHTGEPAPIVVVTDNGSPMRSATAARWFAARPHFAHVRTRHRSPHTNGVIERWFESLKYERLYRHDITDGVELADHVAGYLDEYNRVRPHEHLDWRRPLEAHLETPTLKPHQPETEQQT
ncbi:MAG: integrase core domain-containing protein [Acidimicrobiaceae bacterium]|nr:integrase core domain-containing protein [Acidimicrobiaceae bacterium]